MMFEHLLMFLKLLLQLLIKMKHLSFCLQLEMLLREKVKTSYFELKKKFKDVDPQEKGNVSR